MIQASTADVLPECDHPGTVQARVWAARITECWRASIEGIFRTGRLLLEAKADLVHGEFGTMIERDLPFGARTAQMLMAVASDIRLSNPKHVSLLPASWSTLAKLTELTDDEFDSAVAQRIIRPDMIRADVEQIKALSRPLSSDGGAEVGSSPSLVGKGEQRPHLSGVMPAAEVSDTGAGPSETLMPSGGLAIAHPRVEPADSLDFFPTPPWATRALIEHVFAHLERKGHCRFQNAWEPACGQGHMAEPLKEYFREVRATDIHDHGYGEARALDFLDDKTIWRPDWIITNPPFGTKAEEFVLKALELAGTGVAMFFRLQWLDTVGRYERIFSVHPPTQLAIFAERVPLHKERWEPDGDTFTAYIWLVWIKGAEPRAPFWIPPGCRDALSTPEDLKRFGKVAEGEAA